jgi:hypothetical protein
LLTCGEVNTVKRSFFVGKGIGPLTLAPVRLAVSTISIADLSTHAKFEAEIYVLSKDEGGRHTPFFNNYNNFA